MKSIITKSLPVLFVLCEVVLALPSCTYKKIMDANYPAQLIYMPAAVSNLVIDNVPQPTLADPTPGNPYNLVVDLANNKLNIPLGIYRSGIDNKGAITVNINVNNDTITSLLAVNGKLPAGTVLLSSNYDVPTSVLLNDGQEVGIFNVAIDLDFLRANAPNKIYALAVAISSSDRNTNPKLSTTILVINNKMMIPTANFTSKADATNSKNIIFTNTSTYSTDYTWNFGDGGVSSEKSPSHIYAAAGTYTVTLTSSGLTGAADAVTKTLDVTVL